MGITNWLVEKYTLKQGAHCPLHYGGCSTLALDDKCHSGAEDQKLLSCELWLKCVVTVAACSRHEIPKLQDK